MQEKNKHITDTALRNYINGLYSMKEAEYVLKSLSSAKEQGKLGEEMDRVWNNYEEPELFNFQHALYKKEAHRLLKDYYRKKRRRMFINFLKHASVFLLLLITGVGVTKFIFTDNRPASVEYVEVKVKNGQHKTLTLPDNSQVILNAGSVIRYPKVFQSDTRQIEINGEAFFDVISDQEKPFIIKTQQAHIKVLGTSFNVKAYHTDEQFSVCVQTGAVEVCMPEATLRLLPNEQLILHMASRQLLKKTENAELVKSWIAGGLYFNRTPIYTVIRELERIYDCKIEFAPGHVYEDYIYGEHDNDNLEAVLMSIQHSTNIKYKKEGGKYILYK